MVAEKQQLKIKGGKIGDVVMVQSEYNSEKREKRHLTKHLVVHCMGQTERKKIIIFWIFQESFAHIRSVPAHTGKINKMK